MRRTAAVRVGFVLLAFAVGTLAACAAPVPGQVAGSSWVTGDGLVQVLPVAARQPVGPLRGQLLGGGSFRLASWRGRVVVVNFWASDCAPCRAEAAALQAAFRRTAPDGVAFIGVDTRDDSAAARAFDRVHGVDYPSLFDPTGAAALAFHGLVPDGTPTTVLVDRQGRAAARVDGAVTYGLLLRLIRTVAGGRLG